MIRVVVQDGLKDLPDRLDRFRRSISLRGIAGEMQVVIEDLFDNWCERVAGSL